MIRSVSRVSLWVLVCSVVVLSLPALATAQSPPPDCTNGDCPSPPPDCTNGDCPPVEDDCCCAGSNLPGTIRVCCCRSSDLDAVTCRQSLVLDYTGGEFHQTLAEETLEGFRPEGCDVLLSLYCDRPVEEICARRLGRRICERIVKRMCLRLDAVCQYQFCGPEWFPYTEPAPDQASCEWWDQVLECTP